MLRRDTQQALRALAALARLDKPTAINELSVEANAPAPVLSKVLQRLANAGVVTGRPGRGGGYVLAQPASQITLLEIVHAFESKNFGTICLMGHRKCVTECPFHATWERFICDLQHFLETKTVADLSGQGIFEAIS